ncbi:MAG TPA: kelch repeat-containing protein [Thermoplasmata archaeon]|nr:kelch repeat-containing protein [Thermoplasmata archaeon]
MRPSATALSWVNISSGLLRGPGPRTNASAAYDPDDNLLLLYGGENGTAVLSDTWEFASGAWTELSSVSPPGPRWGAGLAYDAAMDYFVLFGGNNSTGIAARTWLFAAGHWSLDMASGQPKPRQFPAMAYDPAASAVVLFSGAEAGGPSGQVWWLSKGNWTPNTLGGTGTPPNRAGAAFFWYQNASTPANSGLVLFGGYSTAPGLNKLYRDTWIYTNQSGKFDWTELSANSPPPARYDAAVSLDPAAGATLMFGGFGAGAAALGDAWTYNASGWVAASTGSGRGPGARGAATMALAPLPGRASPAFNVTTYPLLVGGRAAGGNLLSDSWFAGPLPLAVLAPFVPSVSDVNTAVQLSVLVLGGGAAGAIVWNGLPTGCSTANRSTLTCDPSQVSSQSVYVTVKLGPLTVTSGTANWTIDALPRISLFTVLPSPSITGRTLTVQVGLAAGTGTAPFTYQYLGLPGGCVSVDLAQFTCSPTNAGTFEIEVSVADADGQDTVAFTNLTVTVAPAGSSTPLWEYAAEGFGVLLVLVIVMLVIRAKLRGGGGSPGSVRRWAPPAPAAPPAAAPAPASPRSPPGRSPP